ncbi:prevent-host-death family protein [Rhodococcus spelaei]|uniref:Prevent-host-death family protein n=1 Tax=Rhodococcus spelaei TaxID=2546320 RepID=A0A541BME8_9NOCA|nr:prevent-host-death family protein [Rhodococcus spelaei]TQF73505.1 prevent-host-death family protein [Rhodococcus spelaei]
MESAVAATSVKSARKQLNKLIGAVNHDTVAVEIAGKHGNAVLISRDRFLALQESTFLLRSPELMDSLRRAAARTLHEDAAAPNENVVKRKPARRRKKAKKK